MEMNYFEDTNIFLGNYFENYKLIINLKSVLQILLGIMTRYLWEQFIECSRHKHQLHKLQGCEETGNTQQMVQ